VCMCVCVIEREQSVVGGMQLSLAGARWCC